MGKVKFKSIKSKKHNVLRGFLAFFLIITLFFQSFTPIVSAQAPQSYGRSYGLLVHNSNAEKTVPKIKVLQVLLKFFPKASPMLDIGDMEQVCGLPFLNCGELFYSYKPVIQREFLIWFHQLSLMNAKKPVSDEPEESLYRRLWLEARQNNWLTGDTITYKKLNEFLYRYEVSKKFSMPYSDGLVLDINEINAQNFSNTYDLVTYESNIFDKILKLKSLKSKSKDDEKTLQALKDYYLAFKAVEVKLRELKHPFNVIPNLPNYVKENISNNGLDEVLAKISYDYSKNAANRKHNLTVGLSKISGKVWMPDDVMDIMEVLADNNWREYKMGWVLFEGGEAWQFGGGLCGVATMVFTPSWVAGLQIIKRYPHSTYYSSLYPKESLGLDATIYRNSQKNLKVRNSTGAPIIYYVNNDAANQIVTVYLIGKSPYRRVFIEGPIKINRTTYKWIRTMEKSDGTVNIEELVTKYGGIY